MPVNESSKLIRTGEVAGVLPERVVLIGFMGAGKSTVGARLAGRLGWQFVDSDLRIEAKLACKIADFFSTHGEEAFRRAETAAIAEFIEERQVVLALGGGSLESSATRSRLFSLPSTLVVHLAAPLDVLVGRCDLQDGADTRPLLRQRAVLQNRLESRLPYYQLAELTVLTEERTPDAAAEQIADYLWSKASGTHHTTVNPS